MSLNYALSLNNKKMHYSEMLFDFAFSEANAVKANTIVAAPAAIEVGETIKLADFELRPFKDTFMFIRCDGAAVALSDLCKTVECYPTPGAFNEAVRDLRIKSFTLLKKERVCIDLKGTPVTMTKRTWCYNQ